MKKYNIVRKVLSSGLLFGALMMLLAGVGASKSSAQPDGALTLRPPSFVNVAYAEEMGETAVIDFPDDEVGIAIYFNANATIDLDDIKSLLRGDPEWETDEYIIGSLPVPAPDIDFYSEDHDVHLYAHVDGWVMAYYHESEPTSKIFDWRNYTIGSSTVPTKINSALSYVAAEIGHLIQSQLLPLPIPQRH